MIPKGQMLIEKSVSDCATVCDKVVVDNKHKFNFQFYDKGNDLFKNDFEENPFYRTNDLSTYIEIDLLANPLPFPDPDSNWFILYSDTKCYFFHWGGAYLLNEVNENLSIVTIEFDASFGVTRLNTIFAINQTFGAETGAVAGAGTNFVSINIFSPIFYYQQNTPITELFAPIQKKLDTNNFYWSTSDGEMCFLNMSEITSNLGTITPGFYFPILIEIDKYISVRYMIENTYTFPINYNITILDNLFLPIYTSPIKVINPNSTINVYEEWKATSGAPNGYLSIDFQSVDIENLISDGLCVDNVDIKIHNKIKEITKTDCNGDITIVPFIETNNAESQLIEIDALLFSGEHFFTITDIDNNEIESIIYNFVDYTDNYECCSFLRLRWTDLCKLNGINYKDFPFVNELMFYGYKAKIALDKVEAISIVLNNGKKQKVFSHTIGKSEVQIHPYSENIMDNLEVVFTHGVLSVDLIEHYPTENDFIVDEIDCYLYSGRVELYKKGSELVKSSCCC
jgi:hypothetical protein